MAVNDGYFDGLVDAYGNPSAYGQYMMSKGWARRTGDGMVLINGGVAQAGSANNPSGTAKNPDGSAADVGAVATPPTTTMPPGSTDAGGGVVASPVAGVTDTPTLPPSNYDPQGMLMGDDGTVWLYTKQYDSTLNAGKGGYVQTQVALGNPTDANYSWDLVSRNTGIPVAVLKQQYSDALLAQAQKAAAAKGLNQWQYASSDPNTGMMTFKNGKNETATVSVSDMQQPDFLAKHPGIDLSEAQRALQQLNHQNWLASQMGYPGDPDFKAAVYYAWNAVAGSAPATNNPVPDPRGGGVQPGATPTPTPTTQSAAGGAVQGVNAMSPSRSTGYPTTGTTYPTPYRYPTPYPTAGATPAPAPTLTGLPDPKTAQAASAPPGTAPGAGAFAQTTPTAAATPNPMPTTGGGSSLTAQTAAATPNPAPPSTAATTPVTTTTTPAPAPAATPSTGTAWNWNGLTVEQAQQKADEARLAQQLAAMGQYGNVTGASGGMYTGTNYLGQRVGLTSAQLLASGQSAGDLYQAQLNYSDQIRRASQAMRGAASGYWSGYDPNAMRSTVAGM